MENTGKQIGRKQELMEYASPILTFSKAQLEGNQRLEAIGNRIGIGTRKNVGKR